MLLTQLHLSLWIAAQISNLNYAMEGSTGENAPLRHELWRTTVEGAVYVCAWAGTTDLGSERNTVEAIRLCERCWRLASSWGTGHDYSACARSVRDLALFAVSRKDESGLFSQQD